MSDTCICLITAITRQREAGGRGVVGATQPFHCGWAPPVRCHHRPVQLGQQQSGWHHGVKVQALMVKAGATSSSPGVVPMFSLEKTGPKTHLALLWSPEPSGVCSFLRPLAPASMRLRNSFFLLAGTPVGEKGGQRCNICPTLTPAATAVHAQSPWVAASQTDELHPN